MWYKQPDICSFKLDWQYLHRSWLSTGMILENVTWVQFSARISAVYSKLLLMNDSVFQFLFKHLHICYRLSYGISDQEMYLAMLHKFCNFSPIFIIFSCWFGHSKKNRMKGYICKVVNSGYENYVICIS